MVSLSHLWHKRNIRRKRNIRHKKKHERNIWRGFTDYRIDLYLVDSSGHVTLVFAKISLTRQSSTKTRGCEATTATHKRIIKSDKGKIEGLLKRRYPPLAACDSFYVSFPALGAESHSFLD